MKTLLAFILVLTGLPVLAGPKAAAGAKTAPAAHKGDEFKGKFLFTHLRKTKPAKDEVSKCFKFNKPSKEVLQSYHQCKQDPKLASPLEEAAGTCVRNSDGANAYFFEDMQECESARAEVVDMLEDQSP